MFLGADDYIVYNVKSGDTLNQIASMYNTTASAIASTNQLADPNKIEVGQQLMIYTAAAQGPIAPTVSKTQANISKAQVTAPSKVKLTPSQVAAKASGPFGINKWVFFGGIGLLSVGILVTKRRMSNTTSGAVA